MVGPARGGCRIGNRLGSVALVLVLGLLVPACGGDSSGTGGSGSESANPEPGGSAAVSAGTPEPTTPPSDEPSTQTVKPEPGGSGGVSVGTPPSEGPSTQSVKLWFTSGEQFDTVERQLPSSGTTLLQATKALLAGPTATELQLDVQTQIPDGVAVETLTVSGSGEVLLKLSPGFIEGIPADPGLRTRTEQGTLDARLGQVIHTLAEFEDVSSAKVQSGGVVLDPSLTPSDYNKPAKGPKPERRPKGERVAGIGEVQRKLAKFGYLPKAAVDGLNGYRTQQAVTAFQAWNGLARDGVVGPATTAALQKGGRPKSSGQGPARRIEVYREKGVTLLIDGGRTVRAIHSSAGKPSTPTPAGTYSVFRKELRSWSYPFSTWLPYASYFYRGIAFHEYRDVPTFPASAGCVRLPAPEAPGVYKFAALNTTVIVR